MKAENFLKELTPIEEARRYCHLAGWHTYGDTQVMLGNGGYLDLPEVMVAFSEQIIKERDAWRKLAQDCINTKLPDPMIIEKQASNED